MSSQGNFNFPNRVQRAVQAADRLAVERSGANGRAASVTSSPEYQELVRLKVVLEVETSRAISESARMSADLERSSLDDELSSRRAEL